MRKLIFHKFILGAIIVLYAASAHAYFLAADKDVERLKLDLRAKRLAIGVTVLEDIRTKYGDAKTIKDQADTCVYNYEKLTLNFKKEKRLKSWLIDPSIEFVDTDKIRALYNALDKTVVKGHALYDRMVTEYGPPSKTAYDDREAKAMTCYYGNIKLNFEEKIVLDSWQAEEMPSQYNQGRGVLTATPGSTKTSTNQASK